jgi:hypothetical protein
MTHVKRHESDPDLKLPPRAAAPLVALVLLLSACGAPPASAEAIATASEAICPSEAYDWHDFPTGDECVGAVEAFFHTRFGEALPPLCGYATRDGCDSCGACELWVSDVPDPNKWDRVTTGTPQLFDMIVFPPPNSENPYGHVAVVDHVEGSSVYVMDDNYVGALEKAPCPHTVSWAPYGRYRLKSLETQGSLDSATCTSISGWAFAPDTPSEAINADLYFDGQAGSSAPSLQSLANISRSDLCTAIGSCDHAFSVPTPIGLMDGAAHQVFLYGIGSAGGGPSALLPGSPKSFTCPPPAIPYAPAIKRHVPDPTVLTAWNLVDVTDLAHFPDAEVNAIPSGPDTPAAPSLIEALYQGNKAIFIVDGGILRHVQNPASMTAWHFNGSTVVVTPPPAVASLPQGLPWPETPFFVVDSTAVYMIDVTTPPDAGIENDAGPGSDASSAVDAASHRDAASPADGGTTIDPTRSPGAPAADASDMSDRGAPGSDSGGRSSGGCSLSSGASSPDGVALLLIAATLFALRAGRRLNFHDAGRVSSSGGIAMRLSTPPFVTLALCLATAACGSSPGPEETTAGEPLASSATSATGSSTSTPVAPSGLMMRASTPPGPATQSFIHSSVVMINWSDIQPTSAADAEWTTLDNQLSALAAAGVQHVRLRIMAGGDAPTWVKRLGGPASGYYNGVTTAIDCSRRGQGSSYGGVAAQNVQGPAACVPFFWTTAYLDQYRSLMQLLEARLTSDPAKYDMLSTIVDSACMAVYAEVFYRGQGDGPTNETLFDAGLTHPADIACQETAITIHKEVFGESRRTSVAINDWDIVQGTAGKGTDGKPGDYRTAVWYDGGETWATYEFAEWARQELTFGGVTLLEVQNNGLHSTGASCPSDGTGMTSYWCYISQYPGRHGFQTQSYVASPKSPSGASLMLLEDLDNGVALHAEYIELPAGMTAPDWALMGCYNAQLLSGDHSPACSHGAP